MILLKITKEYQNRIKLKLKHNQNNILEAKEVQENFTFVKDITL